MGRFRIGMLWVAVVGLLPVVVSVGSPLTSAQPAAAASPICAPGYSAGTYTWVLSQQPLITEFGNLPADCVLGTTPDAWISTPPSISIGDEITLTAATGSLASWSLPSASVFGQTKLSGCGFGDQTCTLRFDGVVRGSVENYFGAGVTTQLPAQQPVRSYTDLSLRHNDLWNTYVILRNAPLAWQQLHRIRAVKPGDVNAPQDCQEYPSFATDATSSKGAKWKQYIATTRCWLFSASNNGNGIATAQTGLPLGNWQIESVFTNNVNGPADDSFTPRLLTVAGQRGDNLDVTVGGIPPTVGISWAAGGTPGLFNFSGNAAATAPATIVRYDWDFGGGDVRLDASANESKTWTDEAASRTVTLTVKDSNGATGQATATLLPDLTIIQAPTDPASVNIGDPASLRVTVANDGPSTVTGVSPAISIGPPEVVSRSLPVTPAAVSLAPGMKQTFIVPFNADSDGNVTGTIDASGTSLGAPVNARQRAFNFVVGNPGLVIALAGQVVELGKSFAVQMSVTNPGVDTVENIVWDAPTGLLLESGDNPPSSFPSVSYVRGPDVALPTSLASKQSVRLIYIFNAPATGASVLTASAHGSTATGHVAVSGRQAMSVLVVGQWTESVRDQLILQGLETAFGAQADGQRQAEIQLAGQITTAFGWQDATAAEVTSATTVGLARQSFDDLLVNALKGGTEQGKAFLTAWAGGLARGMDTFGRSGGEVVANLLATIEQPGGKALIASKVLEVGKTFGADVLTNGGYFINSLKAAPTIAGLQQIVDYNSRIAGQVTTAVGEAWAGKGALVADYAQQYRQDPVAAVTRLGDFWGEANWSTGEQVASAVLSEVGLKAVGAVGSKLAPSTLGLFRSGGTVAGDEGATIAGTEVAGSSAAEAMNLRMAQAAQVIDNYQALPAGTVLDLATVTGKGGVLAEDAAAIQDVIARGNARFGKPFEVAARTSEPLSIGIDGIAKPEFIKPKAVSILDQMMGADPARAGKVGLFEPVPLDAEVVRRLDAANPGFAAKYTERLASQQKLWAEWSNTSEKSALRVLTEAGEVYKDKGGITVLNPRPGAAVPYDLKYLEQLDEPATLAAKGINPADVPGIKQQIRSANIDTFKASPVARVGPNGTVFIDDALSGKPFVSDLDLQRFGPQDGVWPAGHSRGEVETWFKAEFSKLQRFPFHGASDAAYDLPSAYYSAAIPFQLGNANPAFALEAANRIAGRLQNMETLARARAAQLLAAGDAKGAAKVLDPFSKLSEFKDANTGLYSSTKLLKKFPPGEKTINFTAGDIRVGYGSGGG